MARISVRLRDGSRVGMEREEAYKSRAAIEVSVVFPCRRTGEIILELRARKKLYSGMFAPPSETLREDESYLKAAERALSEELKIDVVNRELVDLNLEYSVFNSDSEGNIIPSIQRYFGYPWEGDVSDINFNRSEVSDVRLVHYGELNRGPFFMPLEKERVDEIIKRLKKKDLIEREKFLGIF